MPQAERTTIKYDATVGEGIPPRTQPLILETSTLLTQEFKDSDQAQKALDRKRKISQAATVLFSASTAGNILLGVGEIYSGLRSRNLTKTARGVFAIGASVGTALVAERKQRESEEIESKQTIIRWANFNARAGIGRTARTSVFRFR